MIIINHFLNHTNPGLFTLSAVAVGAVLVDDFNVYEQNSIGNWIIMAGQYVLTYAAQQQLLESNIYNYNVNINSKSAKNGGSIFTDGRNKSNWDSKDDIDMLIQAINRINQELESIKKNM